MAAMEQTDDGSGGRAATFTLCSFWLVFALAEIGEHRRADDLCEKVPPRGRPGSHGPATMALGTMPILN